MLILNVPGHSMSMEQNDIANECWKFELWLYEQAGVSRCCLSLQDRYGVAVVLLLLCAWLGTKGRALSKAEIREAVTQVAPWRATIVECIRRVRRNFRSLSCPEHRDLSRLYKDIKLSELRAERIELTLLVNYFNWQPSTVRRGGSTTNIIEDNVLAYLTEFITERDRQSITEEVMPIISACAHYKSHTQSRLASTEIIEEHAARAGRVNDDLLKRIGVFLDKNYIMSLATFGPSGVHAANLLYARDRLSLIWVSDPESQHSRNIETYKKVAATVAAYSVDFDTIQGIQIHGAAKRQHRDDDGSRLLDLLKNRYPALKGCAGGSDAVYRALRCAEVYLLEPFSITFIDNTKDFGYKQSLSIKQDH
jgi:uncharacterized protein